MARFKLLVSAAAIFAIAVIAVLCGMQYQARLQLRDQADSLQEQLRRLAQLEIDNIRLSNIVAQANTPLSEAQLTELQRLREQLELLRHQTNQVQNLRGEITRLRIALSNARKAASGDSPPDVPPEDIYPKDSWKFAGYDTPEATVQSVVWAINEGDQDSYMDGLSSDLRDQMQSQLADGSFADTGPLELSNASGFRIIDRDPFSDSEEIITIYLDGDQGEVSLVLDKTDNGWVVGGVDDN